MQKFAEIHTYIGQLTNDAEDKFLNLQKISLAKDKKITSLERQLEVQQKEMILNEVTAYKEREEVMEGAKLSAAIAMLKIKLQMAKEAEDPAFDRSAWDQEGWKQRLAELDDEDPEEVLAIGDGSGEKDEAADETGGEGDGEAAKV